MDIQKNIQNLCMGCMNIHNSTPCEHCHFNEIIYKNERLNHILPMRTILNGKYILGKVLGEGGFGITYIGLDLNLELKLAIKEYYPSGYARRDTKVSNEVQKFTGEKGEFFDKGLTKFLEEAKNVAKFNNAGGIVRVVDFFRENNTAYMVMEYVEGITLKDYLKRNGGKIPYQSVLNMMRPVISSLALVHQEGIIHRDISPDNIMIDKSGNMKLIDFGAARDFVDENNRSMSILLKPGFAPEEQYRTRGHQGPWSDVYALCATIYKMITGITPVESLERRSQDTLLPLSRIDMRIPITISETISKGMAVLSENRIQDMRQLYSMLYGNELTNYAGHNVDSSFRSGLYDMNTMYQQNPDNSTFSQSMQNSMYNPNFENSQYIQNNPNSMYNTSAQNNTNHMYENTSQNQVYTNAQMTGEYGQTKKDKKFIIIVALLLALIAGLLIFISQNLKKQYQTKEEPRIQTSQNTQTKQENREEPKASESKIESEKPKEEVPQEKKDPNQEKYENLKNEGYKLKTSENVNGLDIEVFEKDSDTSTYNVVIKENDKITKIAKLSYPGKFSNEGNPRGVYNTEFFIGNFYNASGTYMALKITGKDYYDNKAFENSKGIGSKNLSYDYYFYLIKPDSVKLVATKDNIGQPFRWVAGVDEYDIRGYLESDADPKKKMVYTSAYILATSGTTHYKRMDLIKNSSGQYVLEYELNSESPDGEYKITLNAKYIFDGKEFKAYEFTPTSIGFDKVNEFYM